MKLVVIYDEDCGFCQLTVRLLQRADILSRVTYRPGHYGPDQRIQSLDADGVVRQGMDVIVQIARRSPLLWLLLPFLVVGRLFFGHGPYDFVAARRYRIMGGTCGMP